jgi:membrane fusion protein (multidrug efflux system)
MPNPNGRLIDGQPVRVNLESGTPDEKVVIPQAALIADQGASMSSSPTMARPSSSE